MASCTTSKYTLPTSPKNHPAERNMTSYRYSRFGLLLQPYSSTDNPCVARRTMLWQAFPFSSRCMPLGHIPANSSLCTPNSTHKVELRLSELQHILMACAAALRPTTVPWDRSQTSSWIEVWYNLVADPEDFLSTRLSKVRSSHIASAAILVSRRPPPKSSPAPRWNT